MSQNRQENPLFSLIFNIVLPVFILNKGSPILGPLNSLLVALMFPIFYGAWDIYSRKQINPISFLGLFNVLISGGLAVSGLGGIYFCVKEAAFPLLIGIFVAWTAQRPKTFIETIILNPQALNMNAIEEKLMETGKRTEFRLLAVRGTLMMALSFLISAVLNYLVAKQVFLPLADSLTELERSTLLNEQIAKMTSMSVVSIMIPSIVMMMGVVIYIILGLAKITGLKTDQLMKS